MSKLLLLVLLLLQLHAWEPGQPGDYSYGDYSYQDYSYDVSPPSNSDYTYDTGTYEDSPGASYIEDASSDIQQYNYNTGEFE